MKILIAMLVLTGYLWTDAAQADDQTQDVAAMCAAIYYSGVKNSAPEVRDVLYERAAWWLQFTTQAEVDKYIDELIQIIEEGVKLNQSERVNGVIKEGLSACESIRLETLAALKK